MDYSLFKEIEQYESGGLSFEKTVKLFQNLVDSGKIINMNNDYYARANSLIDFGHITQK
tara:strand:- start:7394 stop:7570 length:177 start_codon:yes stop_codon:yes gene_type:complete